MPAFYKELGNVLGEEIEMVPIHWRANWTMEILSSNVADMTYFARRASVMPAGVAWTTPYGVQHLTVITKRAERSTGMWQVFAPFTLELWVWIVGAVALGGLVMALINRAYAGPGRLERKLEKRPLQLKEARQEQARQVVGKRGLSLSSPRSTSKDPGKGEGTTTSNNGLIQVGGELKNDVQLELVPVTGSPRDQNITPSQKNGTQSDDDHHLVETAKQQEQEDPRSLVTAVTQDALYSLLFRLPFQLYHAFSVLLGGAAFGGDEYDLYGQPSVFGRLYRLGLLFLVLVVQNTYIANLASFLTQKPVQIFGPKTFPELRRAKCCVRQNFVKDADVVQNFVKELVFPPAEVGITRTGDSAALNKWERDTLHKGGCDCVILNEADALATVLANCETMELQSQLSFLPSFYVLIVKASNSELAGRLTNATLALTGRREYQELLTSWTKKGETCSEEAKKGAGESEEAKITFDQMGGVFLVFGITSGCALLLTWAHVAIQRQERLRSLGGKEWCGEHHNASEEAQQNKNLNTKLNLVLEKLAVLSDEVTTVKSVLDGGGRDGQVFSFAEARSVGSSGVRQR